MYKYNKDKKAAQLEAETFKNLHINEDDIEEMLRNNIDMICGDEESMLIVGRQVMNQKRGRSDLTAIDSDGNMILIELKRDKKDMENRAEALEFQAIRYAASYATINTLEDLVKQVYALYIEKYRDEYSEQGLTAYELGIRKVTDFLKEHNALHNFNKKQRIILVASEFDEQTLSAVSWLCSNGVDISCFQLTPYKIGDDIYIKPERLLPIVSYDSYYIELMDHTHGGEKTGKKISRQTLPKIGDMLEWGVVNAGDIIMPKDKDIEAVLCEDGKVDIDGEHLSLQAWLKSVYGWSSVETYVFSIHKKTNKSLSAIREEYMTAHNSDGGSCDEVTL